MALTAAARAGGDCGFAAASTRGPGRFVDAGIAALPRPSRSPRPGLLDLGRNELVHPRLEGLVEAALRAVPASAAIRYAIYDDLLAELAPLLGCEPSECEVFPGSDDAIGVLFDALSRGCRHVLLQDPAYPTYEYQARLRRLEVMPWLPRPGAYRHEGEDAVRALDRLPPAVVVVVDPHGSFGGSLPLEGLDALTAAAGDRHLVVVDECYAAFAGRPERWPHGGPRCDAGRLVRVGSLSKSLGLAGMRIGYVVGPPLLVDYLRRWRRANAVSAASLKVAIWLLGTGRAALDRIRDEVVDGRDWLAAEIRQARPSWTPLPSDANFLTVDTGSPGQAAGFAERLARRSVAVRTHAARPVYASLLQITAAPRDVLLPVVEALAEPEPAAEPAAGSGPSAGGEA